VHLVVGDVGHRVDGQVRERPDPEPAGEGGEQDDEEAVFD